MPRKPELPSPDDIDRLYGLEPVIEPGQQSGEPTCFVEIGCPSCGEHYGIEVDLTNGDFTHIEDCQVCCQPMQVLVTVDRHGRLGRIHTKRLDEV